MPHRARRWPREEQAAIHDEYPHGLRVPRPPHGRIVDAVVPPVRRDATFPTLFCSQNTS
jgi:hypothetical protein